MVDVLQFEYICQLMLDANGMILFLKLLNQANDETLLQFNEIPHFKYVLIIG